MRERGSKPPHLRKSLNRAPSRRVARRQARRCRLAEARARLRRRRRDGGPPSRPEQRARSRSGRADLLLTSVHVGAIGLERTGDTTVNAVLLGANLPFVTPGANDVAGIVGGGGFEWRTREERHDPSATPRQSRPCSDRPAHGLQRGGGIQGRILEIVAAGSRRREGAQRSSRRRGAASQWQPDCEHATSNGAPGSRSAWTDGDCSLRAVGSGSWNSPPEFFPSASRSWDTGAHGALGANRVSSREDTCRQGHPSRIERMT